MHQNKNLNLLPLLLLGLCLCLPVQAEGLLSSLGLGGEQKIMTVEEAYIFNAQVAGPEQLLLQWQIAEGTYLFQETIQIQLLEADGISLGPIARPKPYIKKDALRLDGTYGDTAIYTGELEMRIPLERSNPDPTDITLEVRYQGCSEVAGICYPPRKERVSFSLPAAAAAAAKPVMTAAPPPAPTAAAPVAEQDQLAAIVREGNLWLISSVFFIAGLGLALTPCIFPMIPILSGIIAGHGERITPAKGFTLSLVYVLAMSIIYTAAGVLAGLFGGNLQAAFQNPWILSSFAALFIFLALSMFGLFNLQLPHGLQGRLTELSNRQRGGSYLGVAIMGFLSALIVGPCVAPPLAAALIVIGQTGDALRGGLGLFALSLGMGAPLLLLGASAGKLLPKAGAWMDAVKAVFGVGMLAVAIVMLERMVPPPVAMALWGTLLIVSAIYMGALRHLPIEATGWERLWKGLGVVLLVYGALMLVGAAAGGRDTIQPLRGVSLVGGSSATQQPHTPFRPIKSVADLERELDSAKAQNRPVMLDFYADWCVSCKELERYTFSDPQVAQVLSGFVLLQADVTDWDETDIALINGHFDLPGPPGIIFYGRDGVERPNYRVIGFMEAEAFATHARAATQ
jgi:thiol:disulfide interchange protein DsbD